MFKETINQLFNWKKYPSSVFFLVVPLALIGFGSTLLVAILQMKLNGDPWYLVIFLAGIALFLFSLWPIRKNILDIMFNEKVEKT